MTTLAKFVAVFFVGFSLAAAQAFAVVVTPSSGPAVGGNTVTISGGLLGNGDITNVTLCGVSASILSQTNNTVVVRAGVGTPGGGDVQVLSVSLGTTVVSNGYTYNPAGVIFTDGLIWATLTNMPAVRDCFSGAGANGKVYVMGGNDAGSVPNGA